MTAAATGTAGDTAAVPGANDSASPPSLLMVPRWGAAGGGAAPLPLRCAEVVNDDGVVGDALEEVALRRTSGGPPACDSRCGGGMAAVVVPGIAVDGGVAVVPAAAAAAVAETSAMILCEEVDGEVSAPLWLARLDDEARESCDGRWPRFI